LIPHPSLQGRRPFVSRREVVNAIGYVLRSGCPWRMLPHEFPKWQTVDYNFRRWEREGVWDHILHTLRMRMRPRQGPAEEPSAAIIDSQSIKTSAVRGPEKGYDMGKKRMGSQAPRARGKASQSAGCQGDRSPEMRSARRPSLVGAVEGGLSQDEAHVGR
jgi:transposase